MLKSINCTFEPTSISSTKTTLNWDATAWIDTPLTDDFSINFSLSDAVDFSTAVGITANPGTTNPGTFEFALYSSAGNELNGLRSGGASAGKVGAYLATDKISLVKTGTALVFSVNDAAIWTVSTTTAKLYFQTLFYKSSTLSNLSITPQLPELVVTTTQPATTTTATATTEPATTSTTTATTGPATTTTETTTTGPATTSTVATTTGQATTSIQTVRAVVTSTLDQPTRVINIDTSLEGSQFSGNRSESYLADIELGNDGTVLSIKKVKSTGSASLLNLPKFGTVVNDTDRGLLAGYRKKLKLNQALSAYEKTQLILSSVADTDLIMSKLKQGAGYDDLRLMGLPDNDTQAICKANGIAFDAAAYLSEEQLQIACTSVAMLRKFEKYVVDNGGTLPALSSYLEDLRRDNVVLFMAAGFKQKVK